MSRGAHGHPDWSPTVPTDTPLDADGRAVWSREHYQVALLELRAKITAQTHLMDLEEAKRRPSPPAGELKRPTPAPARTHDNEIAKWADEIRRERDRVARDGRHDPPVAMQINLVPFAIRAGLMAALRGDGIVSMRDERSKGKPCTVLTFRPPASPNDEPPVDHDPDEPAVETAARRLRDAQDAERTVRSQSLSYAGALHRHRRAVVRSQARRMLCAVLMYVVAVVFFSAVGTPTVAAIIAATVVMVVVDIAAGRPMVTARLSQAPHPGDWPAVCQRYEDAVLELYAAEIVDGIARMEAAAAERDALEAGS